ncbi:KdsC family phosphatase [Williamwhitmania taraxaci]|uniref:3-deoxy-D-manno-octulosonate 8-phosphate phosphatase (KDO 8-P phosphatase) n=1 Tax=Williamwhitmania taraxaci TaxID=1640674 RepID=A0A1G6GJ32_9BACT|nr:HAD-IIIA family hydrolase [Williamwhitmania taraxaci]SDB82008.1 3-deoxy-D-manno-octulosonate 8-phosphate phosphatase (KDO 8-P phosphatase) [Williamwhitmania taraxaci]
MSKFFKDELKKVKAFAFDVDGVFTDGKVFLHPSGEMLRTSHMRDGYAVQLAIKMGFPVAIISGGKSESLRARFQGLGITDIYLGSQDKMNDLLDFHSKHSLAPEDILYMGDDLPDYEVLQKVGMSCCPSDAVAQIKGIVKYVSPFKGGEGCVRDVIEQVLRLQNHWPHV